MREQVLLLSVIVLCVSIVACGIFVLTVLFKRRRNRRCCRVKE